MNRRQQSSQQMIFLSILLPSFFSHRDFAHYQLSNPIRSNWCCYCANFLYLAAIPFCVRHLGRPYVARKPSKGLHPHRVMYRINRSHRARTSFISTLRNTSVWRGGLD